MAWRVHQDAGDLGNRSRYFRSKAPGVYLEKRFRRPRQTFFSTGVPAFLGLIPASVTPATERATKVRMITSWPHFEQHVVTPGARQQVMARSFLAAAVRGFFENGGHWCYVVTLEDDTAQALNAGLDAISALNTIDLVCAPDLVSPDVVKGRLETVFELQQLMLDHCQLVGDRFAILDGCYDLKAAKADSNKQVRQQWLELDGDSGAIYYPWVKPRGSGPGAKPVPPCGHVAGVYARTDRQRGVHKAPANEVLQGVADLERLLTSADQDQLNPSGVNCLRSFPGRGLRVWGARTVSLQTAWIYVNVRRLFLTAVRWIEWNMTGVAFEPNNPTLWARIERQLRTYFTDLFRKGALKGQRPEESFYIKCDAETNPPEIVERGQVVTEIGLAPTIPYEFVVIRLIYGDRGVTISGPIQPQ